MRVKKRTLETKWRWHFHRGKAARLDKLYAQIEDERIEPVKKVLKRGLSVCHTGRTPFTALGAGFVASPASGALSKGMIGSDNFSHHKGTA